MVPEGNHVFTREELLEAMALKAGDIYSADRLKKSETLLLDIYGRMGFLDTRGGDPAASTTPTSRWSTCTW